MDHLRGKWSIDVPRPLRVCGLAILAALLLLSCEPPSYTTIEWEADGDGYVRYSTNDPHYYSTAHYLPIPNSEDPMDTVTATVKKVSGSSVGGFGIVFCYVDENNYYRLLITTEGKYNVWKVVGGTWTEKVPWDDSVYLNPDMGATNDIGITQNPLGTFTVTFNTHDVTFFTDSSFTLGDAGPCIWIGAYTDEKFPKIPEDGRFKMTAPGVYPP